MSLPTRVQVPVFVLQTAGLARVRVLVACQPVIDGIAC
jgi:hypothetical protein